jgi:hypothetical protein
VIYSVFDWQRGVYRYYQTNEPDEVSPSPRKASPRSVTEIGVAPEDIAARIPAGARPAGSGHEARGIIATAGFDGGSSMPSTWVIVGLIVAAIGIYKYAR